MHQSFKEPHKEVQKNQTSTSDSRYRASKSVLKYSKFQSLIYDNKTSWKRYSYIKICKPAQNNKSSEVDQSLSKLHVVDKNHDSMHHSTRGWKVIEKISLMSHSHRASVNVTKMGFNSNRKFKRKSYLAADRSLMLTSLVSFYLVLSICSYNSLLKTSTSSSSFLPFLSQCEASLIIGDSAIEIQEVPDDGSSPPRSTPVQTDMQHPRVTMSSPGDSNQDSPPLDNQQKEFVEEKRSEAATNQMPGPLPPISMPKGSEDVTDGDGRSRPTHDIELNDIRSPVKSTAQPLNDYKQDELEANDKPIAGKVVDFELISAGGHNKAKIKKKKKKKKEESMHKKWAKKKKSEKKAMEKKHKEHMKKKKEEGKKGKKKWGKEEHGQKKKGNFKKKKWGKKVKKGKGVKKGKKGKKFLKDKGHKNTGFKTVYHKEEWGKSNKWHDIKREKKWDEKSKKWKKKWKKEKGKKYKGDHMKKFEKKKKSGKKYKKEKKDKYKKFKKEEFHKGMKKKKEEHGKKKEGGVKKDLKEMKKKKKKKG